MPSTLIIGTVEYRNLNTISKELGMSPRAVRQWLKDLQVPVMFVEEDTYFLLSAFEEAVYACMQVGEKGLLAPGSKMKAQHPEYTDAYTELPPHLQDPKARDEVRKRLNEEKSASRARRASRVKKALKSRQNGKT